MNGEKKGFSFPPWLGTIMTILVALLASQSSYWQYRSNSAVEREANRQQIEKLEALSDERDKHAEKEIAELKKRLEKLTDALRSVDKNVDHIAAETPALVEEAFKKARPKSAEPSTKSAGKGMELPVHIEIEEEPVYDPLMQMQGYRPPEIHTIENGKKKQK
jgi:seryl-tRNA synthetase